MAYLCQINTTIKITSEYKNVLVMAGVVDGLALHGKQTWISVASTGGYECGRSSFLYKFQKNQPDLVSWI